MGEGDDTVSGKETNLSHDGVEVSHMIAISNLLVASGRDVPLGAGQQYQCNVEQEVQRYPQHYLVKVTTATRTGTWDEREGEGQIQQLLSQTVLSYGCHRNSARTKAGALQ